MHHEAGDILLCRYISPCVDRNRSGPQPVMFTQAKRLHAYHLAMGTKQHKTFCGACAKTTNHVTVYQKADDDGQLVATVRCAEHSDEPAWS
jgi:hypothetical protein